MLSHQLPRTAAEVALARTQRQGSAGFKRKGEVPVDSAAKTIKERPQRIRYCFLLSFLFSVLILLCSVAGFASQDVFLHGFFSAAIKLPADYAAGVVVAFYLSNGDVYEKTHDELDFEFLGNVRRRKWRVQTNVYGNGSTHAGREERYDLPFDPTDDFHHYSILWTSDRIM
ncbi:probable xyloglucan endotransglucosylase/hydrolase protein 28 [Miscanthus floridulus]|uniref:probable xyloglucan endotransglucosylase/hydrolase protein 28 n=1 Tax=Miscanthus floridulus TaxID=154761 RepID=UPI003457A75B